MSSYIEESLKRADAKFERMHPLDRHLIKEFTASELSRLINEVREKIDKDIAEGDERRMLHSFLDKLEKGEK